MAGISTAWADQAKSDVLSAGQCMLPTVTPTGNLTNTAFTAVGMSSVSGVAVGMAASGTGIPAGAVVASLDSASQITLSKAATATNTGVTITLTGDAYKFALIKHTPTGTYGQASQYYSDITGNSDEVSGTGYTATGFALTNGAIAVGSHVAYTQPTTNPSWTSATIDTDGGMMYDTSVRLWPGNRCVATFDFGGEQKVTAGTLTIVLPTNNSSSALLRLS